MLETLQDPEHAALVMWIVGAVASGVVTVVGSIGGVIIWLERRNDRAHQDLSKRVNDLDQRLSGRIDGLERHLTERIDGLYQLLLERLPLKD